MNLHGFELEQRLEAIVAEALGGPGGLAGLDGFKLKKLVKKVGKVVRKVAPIALGAGALFTGGALGAGVKAVAKTALKKGATKIFTPRTRAEPEAPSKGPGRRLGRRTPPFAPSKGPSRRRTPRTRAPSPSIAQESSAALDQAQAAGTVPQQPTAGASVIDIATQVARTVLANQGVPVASPAAQQVVREVIVQQAAQPAPLTPVPAPGDTVQDVQEAAPALSKTNLLIGGGLAAALIAAVVLARPSRGGAR